MDQIERNALNRANRDTVIGMFFVGFVFGLMVGWALAVT